MAESRAASKTAYPLGKAAVRVCPSKVSTQVLSPARADDAARGRVAHQAGRGAGGIAPSGMPSGWQGPIWNRSCVGSPPGCASWTVGPAVARAGGTVLAGAEAGGATAAGRG